MSITSSRYYKNKIFRSGDIARGFKNLCAHFGGNPEKVLFGIRKTLKDGSFEGQDNLGFDSLYPICDIATDLDSISFRLSGEAGEIYFSLGSSKGDITIYVNADNAELVAEAFNFITKELELEETISFYEALKGISEEISASDKSIIERLEATELALEQLKEFVTRREKKLRCFLSYRFSSETEPYIMRIQHFLNLLNVYVITGTSYEPNPISVKVASRLSDSINFIVLIVTASGESVWTCDEIAFAHGRGIPVIPLVEEGANFTPGLFGNQEYVGFSVGHIGDTFIQLLEAVIYLRAQLDMPPKSQEQ